MNGSYQKNLFKSDYLNSWHKDDVLPYFEKTIKQLKKQLKKDNDEYYFLNEKSQEIHAKECHLSTKIQIIEAVILEKK